MPMKCTNKSKESTEDYLIVEDFRRRRSRVQRRIPPFQVCLYKVKDAIYRGGFPDATTTNRPVRTYQQTGRAIEHPHCGNQMHAFP